MIEFFLPIYRALFDHFSYEKPRWVSFCPDGVFFCPEYHPQPLFFTPLSHTPFMDMFVHKTPPTPPKKQPFSWPELESGQSELLSGQPGLQLGTENVRKVDKTFLEVGKQEII